MITENKLYNPANQSKKYLIEHFIAHTKVFKTIWQDISSSKMKYPEQPYIIQGQRGMGKTTLLLRIKYEIENSPELSTWLIPVFFNEETYDITGLSDLWEKLLKYIDTLLHAKYFSETEALAEQPDYEKSCFELLLKALHENNRKILLLYDNFGELFLDNLNEKQTHRLREILTTCADIRIVGASAVVLEGLHDYSKPFYEFFKIIYLQGLSKDETYELIQKLQEQSKTQINLEENKAKIETLAILSGGVIRTVMLIYEVILTDNDGSALKDLDSILDKATPLYKHRIEVLPAQQRKIVDAIAKNWDAVSVNDLTKMIRVEGKPMTSKLISAQLAQLDKNNFIDVKETNNKNKLYQLKERFFNIWYLMRHGDENDKCRVKWFTRYLELFYGDSGLKDYVIEHIKKLKTGLFHPDAALFVADAVANSRLIDISTIELLYEATIKVLPEDKKENLQQHLTKNLEALFLRFIKIISDSPKSKLNEVRDSIEKLSLAANGMASIKGFLLCTLGAKYLQEDDLKMAINCWEEATSIGENDIKALALFNLGAVYTLSGNEFEKGEKYIEQCLKSFTNENVTEMFSKDIAMTLLAYNYFKSNKKKKEAYDIVKKLEGDDKNELNIKIIVISSLIYLWNNNYEKSFNLLIEFFTRDKLKLRDSDIVEVSDVLLLFIAKRRYHTALKLFEINELKLKDKFKPIHYALMHYIKDEKPNEILKMGDELKEPVEDVIKQIEQMAVDYA